MCLEMGIVDIPNKKARSLRIMFRRKTFHDNLTQHEIDDEHRNISTHFLLRTCPYLRQSITKKYHRCDLASSSHPASHGNANIRLHVNSKFRVMEEISHTNSHHRPATRSIMYQNLCIKELEVTSAFGIPTTTFTRNQL